MKSGVASFWHADPEAEVSANRILGNEKFSIGNSFKLAALRRCAIREASQKAGAGSLFRVRKSDDPADFANTGFADAGLDQRRFHFEFTEGFDAGTIDGEVRCVRAVADGALAAGFAGNVDEFCEEMRFADIAAVDAARRSSGSVSEAAGTRMGSNPSSSASFRASAVSSGAICGPMM